MPEGGLINTEKVHSRKYQEAIAGKVAEGGNSLVILPTGLGKTIVALLVIERKLMGGKRVLFMAPTRPLAEQHQKTLSGMLNLPPGRTVLLTGTTPAEKRAALWQDAFIICATPQTIENDLRAGRISLDRFGLCVVDEAHRSIKKYAYTYVAEVCKSKGVQLLGLTASPGGKRERIEEVTKALGVKLIEIRTEADEDVAPYVKKLDVKWVGVVLPQKMQEMKEELDKVVSDRLAPLRNMHLINTTSPRLPKRVILEVGKKLMAKPDSDRLKFVMLSHYATVMNLMHAHELLETQGISAFLEFFRKLEAREKRSKAVDRILTDPLIKRVLRKAEEFRLAEGEHPKLAKLVELLKMRPGKKIIVFVQFRDQVKRIVEELKAKGFRAEQFVGKREGVKLKDQKETIQKFRDGLFDVMVASSIGEEGLDIPSVDAVIFYEPIPSEIRSIQRRGRAGRAKAGEVVIMITRDTRDEAYFWVARRKESKMRSIVKGMQAGMVTKEGQEEPESDGGKASREGQAKMTEFLE